MNFKKSHLFTLGLMLTALSVENANAAQMFKSIINSKDPTATLEDTRRMQMVQGNPDGRRNQEVHNLAIIDRVATSSNPFSASIQPTTTEVLNRAEQRPLLQPNQVVIEAQVAHVFPGRDVTTLTAEEMQAGSALARLAPTLPRTEVPTQAHRDLLMQRFLGAVLHNQTVAGGGHVLPPVNVVLATVDEQLAGNLLPSPQEIAARIQLRDVGIVAVPNRAHPLAIAYIRDVLHIDQSITAINAVAHSMRNDVVGWTQVNAPTEPQVRVIEYLQGHGIATPVDANVVALTYLRTTVHADLITPNPTKEQILAVTHLQTALGTVAPTLVEVQEIAGLQGKGIAAPTAAHRAAFAFLKAPGNVALGMQNPSGNQIKAAALLDLGAPGLPAIALNVQTADQINEISYLMERGIDAPIQNQVLALQYLRVNHYPNPSSATVNAIAHIQVSGWMAQPMWANNEIAITDAVEDLQALNIAAPTLFNVVAYGYLTDPNRVNIDPTADQVTATSYLQDTTGHPSIIALPDINQINATVYIRKAPGGADGGLGNANPDLPLITTVTNLQTRVVNRIERPTMLQITAMGQFAHLVGLDPALANPTPTQLTAMGHLTDVGLGGLGLAAAAVTRPQLDAVEELQRAPISIAQPTVDQLAAAVHLKTVVGVPFTAPNIAAVDHLINAGGGAALIPAPTATQITATAHLMNVPVGGAAIAAAPNLPDVTACERVTRLINHAPTAQQHAFALANALDTDQNVTAGVRLVALLGGRVPSAGEIAYAAAHLGDADAALAEGAADARLALLLGGRAPTAEEAAFARANLAALDPAIIAGAVNARLTTLLGRAPNAAELGYAGGHLADADLVLLPALDDARLGALIVGRPITLAEQQYAAAHRGLDDVAFADGLVGARLQGLLGGRAPTAEEMAFARGNIGLADLALTAGAVDARLTALLGRAPNAQETAYAAGNLTDTDAALTTGVVNARLTHLIGVGRVATAEETAYARAHLADLDPALTDGIATARLTTLLGRAPNAVETAYAGAHLGDADLVLLPALDNARLVGLIGAGRAPSPAELLYAGAHRADTDVALTNGIVTDRLTPLLGGRVPTAEEIAYGVGHLADNDVALTAGAVDARLTALFGGRAPTAQETAYAAGNLADNDVALTAGVVHARLTHLIGVGRAPTLEETAYATANLGDLDPALTDGIATARLTALLGRAPSAAEIAHAGGHLGDLDAVLVPAVVNVRLTALLGRAPNAQETAYGVLPASLANNDAVLMEGATRARLAHLLNIAPNLLTPEQVNYAVAHPLDADAALLTATETARLTAILAAGAGGAPTAPQVAEAVRLGHNANFDEIQEGLDLWNGGAGIHVNYDQVAGSLMFRAEVAQANADALAAHQAIVAALPVGGIAPVAPVPVVYNPTVDELQESVRLVNLPGINFGVFSYQAVQDALQVRNQAVAGGVPNPYALVGGALDAATFEEIARLRRGVIAPGGVLGAPLPVVPFAGGVSYRQLMEAMRLKAFPVIAGQPEGGATEIQIRSSLKIQRNVGGGIIRWIAGVFGAAGPGPMIPNPTPDQVNAAVLLRTQQNLGGGALIDQPDALQVRAVANPDLDAGMKAAVASAIQNPIPGVGASNVPLGIAVLLNPAGDMRFVILDPAVPALPPANVFNAALGFGAAHVGQPADAFQVQPAALPVGAVPGDYIAFTGAAAHGVNQIALANATKVN